MILLGHNGAGKTTLINYLLGFYANLNDHPFLKHFSSFILPLTGKKIGYAPERNVLDPQMNAEDYIKLNAQLKGIKVPNTANLLTEFLIYAKPSDKIKTYSKGMKQRLLLAMAFMGDPDFVILDEPTSGLDPFGIRKIEQLIIDKACWKDMIISTHSLNLAFELRKELWMLKEGSIVYKGFVDSKEQLEELFFSNIPQKDY